MPPTTPTHITPAVLDTVLNHLAPHFLEAANNDLPTARYAASRMIASHDPRTEEELQLATDIVSFGFHTLEALSAAAAPDLSLTQKIRLRGSAVSMSRESHKSRRKLDQLQRARLTAPAQPVSEPAAPTPELQPIANGTSQALAELAKGVLAASNKKGGLKAWATAGQKRAAATFMAETSRRNAEDYRRRQAETAASLASAN